MSVSGGAKVIVRADADRVWAMVSDVTRMGEWSPETERAEWLAGASGPVVGARFKGYNRRGKAKWSTICEVIEAEPGRLFAFAVGGAAKPETVWRYRVAPIPEGVEVSESFELVKPLGFFSRLVTRVTTGVKDRRGDLEEGVRSTLAALKHAAESDAPANGNPSPLGGEAS
ncbi:MAG TPA: SRPBCC family protein [Acidimicrobiales bacterium]